MTTRWPVTILIPLLLLHLTGCTSARELALPGAVADPERPEVEKGTRVTVYLVGGGLVTGKVLSITPDTLILGKGGNYGWEETPVAADQIARIEVEEATAFTNTMVVVVAVSMVVLAVVGAMYASALGSIHSSS